MEIGQTELVELDLGSKKLELEQVAGLGALAIESIRKKSDRPYWAYLWPSSRVLARLVVELPDLAEKRVIDLGCGLGALALAAASRGADVTAGDLRQEAVEMTLRNARRHGLSLRAKCFDWDSPPSDLGRFDLILAADVFYEDGMLKGVLRFAREHLAPGGICWIADPMRIMPGGVEGAARLHGMEANSAILKNGGVLTGGVTLYEIWPKPSRL